MYYSETVAETGYYADGLDVNYRALSRPVTVAVATDGSWARHIATALNHWADS